MADPAAPRSLRFAKGAHLIVRLDEPWQAALTTPLEGGRVQFANPWEGALLVGTTDEPYEGDPRALEVTAARHRADRAGVARVDRAGGGGARSHPLELRGRARAAAGRRRDALGSQGDRVRARRGGHALDRGRQVHDLQAHRARRARADPRRPGPAGAGACARAVARRRRSGRRGRPPAARPSRARGRERPAPRALPRQRRAGAARACARGRGPARATGARRARGRGGGALGARARVGAHGRRRARAPHDARLARAAPRTPAPACRSCCDDCALRRRARSGHDEQPLPPVRQGRERRRGRPAGAPPDHAAPGMGRA